MTTFRLWNLFKIYFRSRIYLHSCISTFSPKHPESDTRFDVTRRFHLVELACPRSCIWGGVRVTRMKMRSRIGPLALLSRLSRSERLPIVSAFFDGYICSVSWINDIPGEKETTFESGKFQIRSMAKKRFPCKFHSNFYTFSVLLSNIILPALGHLCRIFSVYHTHL